MHFPERKYIEAFLKVQPKNCLPVLKHLYYLFGLKAHVDEYISEDPVLVLFICLRVLPETYLQLAAY